MINIVWITFSIAEFCFDLLNQYTYIIIIFFSILWLNPPNYIEISIDPAFWKWLSYLVFAFRFQAHSIGEL